MAEPYTPTPEAVEAAARFWSKVDRSGDCWTWQAGRRRHGYGSFYFDGKNRAAHRFSYTLANGEIPDGLVIDHLCGNPPCVRPDHLRAVTQRENVLAGKTLPAESLARTHCPRGHSLTGENLRITTEGHRECRTCARSRWRRNEDRRLAERRLARGEWS